MGRPSKFTAEVRRKVLEALQIGASRETAAAIAGIGYSTLRRWLEQGKNAAPTSRFRQFLEAVEEAEAHPRTRALGIIYRSMEDRPDLAWKFIERREPGFAPPIAERPQVAQPQIVVLTLDDGRNAMPALRPVPNEAQPEAS